MKTVKSFFSEPTQAKKNCFVAVISGILFFTGWWMMVDLHAVYPETIRNNWVYYLPAVFETISFLIVSCVPLSVIKGTYYSGVGSHRVKAALLVLFFGLIGAFGALIGAAYILVHDFLMETKKGGTLYPGFAVFLQTACLFSSNLLMKFATKNEANDL